ncbi:MAG TPA: alpha/beta hydrolase [Candidatus Polarisedimenticolaceae bacterium]|nr:alpha/beta hydrolase [Candidatus Polarisedimenticolaceae bacterium]
MQTTSADGTPLAYDRRGTGPALILVDGALCSRAFGPMPKLAAQLASRFTVYTYDRRGRGESGDTPPYAIEREIEDLEALIREGGGTASLLGLSSGAALALEAAAAGLPIGRVVAYEPPYVNDGSGTNGHEAHLHALVASGDRAAAVKYFMRTMVGVPAPVVVMMQLMPWIWRKMKGVAHTLPYDAAVMRGFQVPAARLASIRVPVLAAHGSKTDPRLIRATRAVAEAVPGARLQALEGQTHNVRPDVLAPLAIEFLGR